MKYVVPCLLILVACWSRLPGQTLATIVIDDSPEPVLIDTETFKQINLDKGNEVAPDEKAQSYNTNYTDNAIDVASPQQAERKPAAEGRLTRTDTEAENSDFPGVVKGQSMIRLGRMAHVQVAVDHDSAVLPVIRTHQYRETHQYASFGPGVFLQYDMKLKVEGGAKNSTRLYSPMDTVEVIVHDGDGDGIGTSGRSNTIKSLCYYSRPYTRRGFDDPANLLTADITTALSAVVTAWTHERFVFELVDLAGDGSDIRGRLVRIEDADGSLLVQLVYRYGKNATALRPNRMGRAALWMLRRAIGGGETVRFKYTAAQVGGAYAISEITLPDRRKIHYAYGMPQEDLTPGVAGDQLTCVDTNWGTDGTTTTAVDSGVDVFGLSRVELPDGRVSAFSSHIDWLSRCHLVEMEDAADVYGHEHKEVYFNLSVWWPTDADPTTGGEVEFADALATTVPLPGLIRQTDNLVKMVVDRMPAEPRCTFFAWHGRNQTGDQAVFYYLADDPNFGGPRFAQYGYRGDYAYWTQYATDGGWWTQDYEGNVQILPFADMSWGSKETCNYNQGFVNWTFSGDLGRNGHVKRDPVTGEMLNAARPHTAPIWR